MVPTVYLQFFEDIDVAGQYAWGTVALAFLFRALLKVVHANRRHLSGSTILLLVIWTTYDDYPDIGEETVKDKDYVLRVRQTALCCTYLICGHIYKMYMPDHVLRQFGLHQGILTNPLQWERRERRGKRYDNWGDELRDEIDMWTNRLDYICQVLKMYDPKVAGKETSEESEFDDEMDDNVPI
ncbi:hypothetical protein AMTR_s00154p00068320 [Amborella trichopoda]|uniref:Aminotransferase-like plant mobile domain-containing protein n=1 Tax=Amborella trichopoda TaxID=13333 RepID=W1PHS7_AMBTC|nr:hypothetical protein AMTR_s00154p00068320 [Amborella trichopoda]